MVEIHRVNETIFLCGLLYNPLHRCLGDLCSGGYILFLAVMCKVHRPLTISIYMEDNWRQNRIVSQYCECFLFTVVVRVDTEPRKLDLIHTSM